ncbi:hypothetical protein MSG28_007962 [Choristoneura fumiferana]|uniref:Uncharacterized protein n=3 Tax=Choristoneura fumiferana TaxID=7141 RepID=A0ACC0J9J5_CHOFU|nr:hypothetical protein MSG28_007962 [Choristoneura fumiferana]
MSDIITDIAKVYEENVLAEQHPRSIGLFTIPEYPELEAGRGMWSAALEAILTTLRYLAPATLLTLFWGQQSFLFKLLRSIDNALRAIVFSSEEQKQDVLQWLAEAGPTRVEHLDTVWRHGWILCGVLDAAMPGACAGHPPTRLSLKHAQSIADHYLGVEPVFSRQELETNDSLSKHQEWKLATFLDRVRQALAKVSPPVSKPTSQRTSPETGQFTLDYVARGSGLTAAQIHNKVYFKIYPTAQQCIDPGEITILIKGPKDTYGMTVLPPIFGKAQLIRQKLLGLQSKPSFTENALPITQGAAYLRSYGKNDMNKTYYIPKEHYDIIIEVDSRPDHSRVGYTVNCEGRHEISITSRGQNIVGSPFTVTASHNIIDILERESFCLEDGEEIDIVDVKSDKKVVLRIVDFVTEKMLLQENGSLEKISEDEAKILMATEDIQNTYESIDTQSNNSSFTSLEEPLSPQRFNTTAQKILKMNRVCKMFNNIMAEKQLLGEQKKPLDKQKSQQIIPDIVNSTFSECNANRYILSDNRDTFIIPENISVSLRTEKPKTSFKEVGDTKLKDHVRYSVFPIPSKDCQKRKTVHETDIIKKLDEDIVSVVSSSSNPFLNDMYEQNYVTEKVLGSYVNTEYETHRSPNEETAAAKISIFVEETDTDTPSPLNTNPFIEPDIIYERPKTPVLKIITGEVKDRDDSVYVDSQIGQLAEEIQGNEFINPFFSHQHHQPNDQDDQRINVTDFIIGAPVSLPPILRAPTPEPTMESIMITRDDNTDLPGREQDNEESADEIFSTPLHTIVKKREQLIEPSSFHSIDSNATENVEIISVTKESYKKPETHETSNINKSVTPKKDMWDSAYVSIDDSNSSPDSNNNDNNLLCEAQTKQKFSTEIFMPKPEDITKMGPAERELWLSCSELNTSDTAKIEDIRPSKIELKRKMFTPIIEENDRSISSGMKDFTRSDSTTKHGVMETVTVAFAELNDMYHEYFPSSENNSLTAKSENNYKQNNEVQYIIEKNDIHVDSASEQLSDVKRRTNKIEGEISEVQSNVTESVSVSQTLPLDKDNLPYKSFDAISDETQFGGHNSTNIVHERKKYWDDKIRQIEAKSEEVKANQKKKRLSPKHMRQNDSLTKRKGKEIAKKILEEGRNVTQNVTEIIRLKYSTPQPSAEEDTQSDVKLVEKWKKYWDDKLEIEKEETESIRSRSRSPKSIDYTPSPQQLNFTDNISEIKPLPVKQELPEEVFKAFETSPKRFFGTSRKQILNKIDSFIAKPTAVDKSTEDGGTAKNETGLVSSRISLFHNISQKEEVVPWKQRKSQSMHNIYERKDSEKSFASAEEVLSVDTVNKTYKYENPTQKITNSSKDVETITIKKETENKPTLQEKRARMAHKIYHKTFDETAYHKSLLAQKHEVQNNNYVKKTMKTFSTQDNSLSKVHLLRKTSMSKSEMDIFNKTTSTKVPVNDLDKYKSCEELPKINVKGFISLYETVSKSAVEPNLTRRASMRKTESNSSQAGSQNSGVITKPVCTTTSNSASSSCSPGSCSTSSGVSSSPSNMHSSPKSSLSYNNQPKQIHPRVSQRQTSWIKNHKETVDKSLETETSTDSIDIEIISMPDNDKKGSYLSLSDLELEIVDTNTENTPETTPEREIEPELKDYKSRFAMAKNYFKSLEELRENKKPPKLNECEMMLYKTSNESLESDSGRPQKRVKKNIKAHSVPSSSEISKVWNEMQEVEDKTSSTSKLVKISEKFNVDDLFNDVMEGRLSRQGSLRGIPHKKAVLETFRSMENVSANKLSSYEMTISQLSQFAKENQIKNAQTYLTEYPYLPTTDPSKYHSRFDTKASGLISMKELLNIKPRRNSVPDLRLNPTFTVDL